MATRSSGGFYTTASGGMGFGMPAAVGIALVDRSRRVVAVLGDGASRYCIQALWTAAYFRLRILFLNNGGYAALQMMSRSRYQEPIPGVELSGIDLSGIATGYGCSARQVGESADLAGALASALAASGPHLLDILVTPPDRPLY